MNLLLFTAVIEHAGELLPLQDAMIVDQSLEDPNMDVASYMNDTPIMAPPIARRPLDYMTELMEKGREATMMQSKQHMKAGFLNEKKQNEVCDSHNMI